MADNNALHEDMKKTLMGEDEEDLFKHRKSVRLLPENAVFYASPCGMVSMKFQGEEGEEIFERVVILRSFPISDPDLYLSVREPDVRNEERGEEIGLIHDIHDFDEATQKLINTELDRRYFTPIIYKVTSVKEKQGYFYWDAETSSGKLSIVINNINANIRTLEDGRVRITDFDGNCFEIPDYSKLDKTSLRKIEIYL